MTTEMKKVTDKTKKRGFVMTGGGAKGLYEAGVIHAFHLCGMEFDVITGSSVGAMNSIFFAEYLYQKSLLKEKGVQKKDPAEAESEAIIRALTPLIQAYHHAWLMMPSQKIVDDSDTGPIGKLKDNLTQYSVSLPWLVKTAWWWTDPGRKLLPPVEILQGITRIFGEVFPTFGPVILLNLKEGRLLSGKQIARSYLGTVQMDKSLVPGKNNALKDLFTTPVRPLESKHLRGDVADSQDAPARGISLIPPTRTLREYADRNIIVRLTRANYRTGRLEISQYVTADDFVRFLIKYQWLKNAAGPAKIPLGSFRLQVPGNPTAVEAGLCSGRFPGVFEPFPVEGIYNQPGPENELLDGMLKGWLNDREVQDKLKEAFYALPAEANDPDKEKHFQDLLDAWRDRNLIGSYFPAKGDVYVDGGSIDNTPSNSAVDYVREWVDRQGSEGSRSDYELELFVIYLSPEPKIDMDKEPDPAIFEVVGRTLKIQGTAKDTADGNTVEVINTFGQRAEALAQTLRLVLQNYQETLQGLPEEEKCRALDNLMASASRLGLTGLTAAGLGQSFDGDTGGLLQRLSNWDDEMLRHKLPLQVNAVNIFPEEMPMDTLQFTERLGYKKENAIKMLVSGCYDTIWTVREHLETQTQPLDEKDQEALRLARKWMGGEEWPKTKDPEALSHLRKTWKCQNIDCVFYKRYCPHGA